jgi:hypothetical protein
VAEKRPKYALVNVGKREKSELRKEFQRRTVALT